MTSPKKTLKDVGSILVRLIQKAEQRDSTDDVRDLMIIQEAVQRARHAVCEAVGFEPHP